MSAQANKAAAVVATIILQCSEGRFDLSVDVTTSIREAKRLFKRAFPVLGDVNMNSFVISYMGKYFPDEAATLKALGIEGGETPAIFFLVKKRDIPSLNPTDAE